jgi:menaquinone-dependent protoporphyrinogen oxidase
MAPRILVMYASASGSAPEIAKAVAAELRSAGYAAATADMKDVGTIENYTAVVIGIPVYTGPSGPGDIGNFLGRSGDPLLGMPVAVFIIGLLPEGVKPDYLQMMTNAKQALRPVTPAAMVLFIGTLDKRKLSFIDHMKDISAIPSGDFQDWEKIRAWARSLPEQLKL